MIIVTEYGFDTEIINWFIKNYKGDYLLKAYGCVPIEYDNHVILPQKFHRMDKLGAASVFGYWMYDNITEEKIVHFDSDVLIKDYSILKMFDEDLNNYNVINCVSFSESKKITSCAFGMTPKIWKNETESGLIIKLLGTWGLDCTMEYYNKLSVDYNYKDYGLSRDNKYFTHFTKLNRGLHHFKNWVKNGDVKIDIGVWYAVASIRSVLKWSKIINKPISFNGVELNDELGEIIIAHMEKKPFDLKEHFDVLVENLNKPDQ